MPDVLPAENTAITQRIVLVVDKSGSMQGIKDDVVGGINAYVAQVKEGMKDGDACYITVVFFDSEVTVREVDTPIADFADFTNDSYRPSGMTAMYDGIGYAINEHLKKGHDDGSVLVIIMTDGAENQSKEYGREAITNLIKEREATGGWTFTFLGADMDAWAAASTIGLSSGNTRSFSKGKSKLMFAGMARATADYMDESRSNLTDLASDKYATPTFFADAGIDETALLDDPAK